MAEEHSQSSRESQLVNRASSSKLLGLSAGTHLENSCRFTSVLNAAMAKGSINNNLDAVSHGVSMLARSFWTS